MVNDHRSAPRIAIFAEGTDQENTDRERTRASFTKLWEHLAARCGVQTPIIKGFSKKALTKMFVPVLAEDLKALHVGPDPERDVVPVTLPPTGLLRALPGLTLDHLIRETYQQTPFDHAIIALDLEPRHNALPRRCGRFEIFMLLESLRRSDRLPKELRKAAQDLKQWYLGRPAARGHGAPRFQLEVLLMDRCFEEMLISDEGALMAVLGLTREPEDWPSFDYEGGSPDRFVFTPACRLAPAPIRARVGDPYCLDKHLWATYVLQQLPDDSKILRHEIFTRLQQLLSAAR